MSGVKLFGQQKTFSVIQHPAALAFPVSQLVPTSDGASLMIYGGLSQFEYYLGQLLANPACSGVQPAELIIRAEGVCDALREHAMKQQDKNGE